MTMDESSTLEAYRDSFIDLLSFAGDGFRATSYLILAVHLPNGECFVPVVGSFIAYGKKLIDWILSNPKKIADWGCGYNTCDLGITIHKRKKSCD
jgi:hypothetical protein